MNDVQKELFEGMERGYVEDPMDDYADYNPVYLGDQLGGSVHIGKPVMLKPFSFDIIDDKTGKEVTKNKFRLCLIHPEDKEYLEIGINLKKEGDVQKNVRKGSVLFDLLHGLMEHSDPGSMEKFNVFKSVDLSSIRDYVNGLELMKIEVVEVKGRFNFNTIKVEGFQ